LDYFSGTAHGRSISIEDGFLISVGAEHSNPSLGGEIDATRALADLNGYIPMPWFKNHVLKMSGTYGAGHGDEYAQGLFGLGGFGSFPASLTPGIARNLGVRGYNTNFQTGQRAVRVGAAYRFPVLDLFKGLESGFPLYNRDLRLEVFYEGGRTYDDNGIGDDIGWLHSAGAEINYGMSILRFIRFAPGIGVAYAPQRDDRDPDENEAVAYISVKLWSSF
jgi:outer membrane protein assembly factor BamA